MSIPSKKLSLLDATMLVAGSMIGSGIFIVSTFMARDLGSAGYMLALWLLTGFITIAAALSYGELAGMMPNAGGQYVYLQRAFGRKVSFLYGWTVFTVIQTGVIAAVAVAFAKFSGVFFPVLKQEALHIGISITYAQLVAIASILFLTAINSLGVQNGKWVQLIFTSAKVLALLALIGAGLYFGLKTDTLSMNFQNMWQASKTTFDNGILTVVPLTGIALFGVLGSTIINPLFSSDAWNNVTFIAGEIDKPHKNIPRSLILGTLLVTVLYLLANVAYLALLPLKGNPNGQTVSELGMMFADQDRIGTAAASVFMGDAAVYVMAALIMVSTFGCNNGLILSGARLFQAMAQDGLFFQSAQKLNRFQVPGIALWVQAFWASMLCLSGKYSDLLTYSTFASLLFYILTITGLFVLRKKEPNADRPYKAVLYPYLPIAYIVITAIICGVLLWMDTRNAGLGLLLVFLGLPVYWLQQKFKHKVSKQVYENVDK